MALSRGMERRLNEVREAYEEAHQAREDAIVEAFHKGASMREIATAVGMSHPGVSKMLERLGLRKRWMSIEDANRELERRDQAAREQQRRKP